MPPAHFASGRSDNSIGGSWEEKRRREAGAGARGLRDQREFRIASRIALSPRHLCVDLLSSLLLSSSSLSALAGHPFRFCTLPPPTAAAMSSYFPYSLQRHNTPSASAELRLCTCIPEPRVSYRVFRGSMRPPLALPLCRRMFETLRALRLPESAEPYGELFGESVSSMTTRQSFLLYRARAFPSSGRATASILKDHRREYPLRPAIHPSPSRGQKERREKLQAGARS